MRVRHFCNQTQKAPRTQHFQSSPRFELPEYISTAPPELLARIYDEKYLLFKKHIKEFFIERYSSLCTQIGCASCHLHIKINWGNNSHQGYWSTAPNYIKYQYANPGYSHILSHTIQQHTNTHTCTQLYMQLWICTNTLLHRHTTPP